MIKRIYYRTKILLIGLVIAVTSMCGHDGDDHVKTHINPNEYYATWKATYDSCLSKDTIYQHLEPMLIAADEVYDPYREHRICLLYGNYTLMVEYGDVMDPTLYANSMKAIGPSLEKYFHYENGFILNPERLQADISLLFNGVYILHDAKGINMWAKKELTIHINRCVNAGRLYNMFALRHVEGITTLSRQQINRSCFVDKNK